MNKRDAEFDFNGQKFRTVQTVHYVDGYNIVPSYGLLWITPQGSTAFLTTDTQFAPNQIEDYYNEADIIFHDCETAPFRSRIHAHYDELKELDEKTRNKMWLYHYQDGDLPDVKADGFAGFVKQRQEFAMHLTAVYTFEEAMINAGRGEELVGK